LTATTTYELELGKWYTMVWTFMAHVARILTRIMGTDYGTRLVARMNDWSMAFRHRQHTTPSQDGQATKSSIRFSNHILHADVMFNDYWVECITFNIVLVNDAEFQADDSMWYLKDGVRTPIHDQTLDTKYRLFLVPGSYKANKPKEPPFLLHTRDFVRDKHVPTEFGQAQFQPEQWSTPNLDERGFIRMFPPEQEETYRGKHDLPLITLDHVLRYLQSVSGEEKSSLVDQFHAHFQPDQTWTSKDVYALFQSTKIKSSHGRPHGTRGGLATDEEKLSNQKYYPVATPVPTVSDDRAKHSTNPHDDLISCLRQVYDNKIGRLASMPQ